jgi:hypothetical protein
MQVLKFIVVCFTAHKTQVRQQYFSSDCKVGGSWRGLLLGLVQKISFSIYIAGKSNKLFSSSPVREFLWVENLACKHKAFHTERFVLTPGFLPTKCAYGTYKAII